jgi:hypothetical protein
MTAWQYGLWGLFGGFAVDGLEFVGAIRRVGGWPWRLPGEPGPLPFTVSVLIRLVIGAGLAAAAGSTGQVGGPFGAVAVGVAAPLLIEQFARQVPLTAIRPTGSVPGITSGQSAPTQVSEAAREPLSGDVQADRGHAS